MFKLYLKSLLEKKWMFLAILFFGIFFIWMYVSIFTTMAASSIEELVKVLPAKLIESMNIDTGAFNTLEGFIGNEKFSTLTYLLTAILAISLAGGYLSGEVEKGTIYLPLSLPLKRGKFYLSKLLAGTTVMATFSAVMMLSVFPMARIYDISIHADRFLKYTLVSVLFGLAIFAFSLFLSSVFSEKNNVAFVTGGIMVLMYVLNVVAGIKDDLEFLKYFSLFHYSNIVDVLVRNNVKPSTYLVFGSAFILFSVLGWMGFVRRDIKI